MRVLADMEAEHATIDPGLAGPRRSQRWWSTRARTTATPWEVRSTAAREGVLEHLAHEEGQGHPMLQRTLSEQENAEFERGVPLQIVPFGLPWAMDGLPVEARARMLASTPPGYSLVLRLLEGGCRRRERRAFRYV